MKRLTVCLILLVCRCSPALADIINIQPSLFSATAGSPLTLDVNITGATDLYAYQFDLKFDPTILFAVSVTNGLFLSIPADGSFIAGTIDNLGGTISATADSKVGFVPGVSGNGTLATFQFAAVGNGSSPITIDSV